MKVLVVIFGGVDSEFLSNWDCTNLKQTQWGKAEVNEVWQQRDVATQITAQLITGKTWKENGINERKKLIYRYKGKLPCWLEKNVFKRVNKGQQRRHALYRLLGSTVINNSREFLKDDLTCPSLFDLVENSKAVYVPAYNPEPTWALDRNILDPRRFPELGLEGALDLLEKHFFWRRKRFMDALVHDPAYDLLVGQFQYIDSTQHLYISYQKQTRMDKIEEAYWRMNEFAGEIIDHAENKYDKVLFISDNGAARKVDYKPTHHNRPFYSLSEPEELSGLNMRDFFNHILRWVTKEPNAAPVLKK